jgi:hypothetical protein
MARSKKNLANTSNLQDFDKFIDNMYVSGDFKPERNLLSAVLARAVCDAFGNIEVEKHVRRTARQWIFGVTDPNQPFSFDWVCNSLDIDPNELRRMLRNYEINPDSFEYQLNLLK